MGRTQQTACYIPPATAGYGLRLCRSHSLTLSYTRSLTLTHPHTQATHTLTHARPHSLSLTFSHTCSARTHTHTPAHILAAHTHLTSTPSHPHAHTPSTHPHTRMHTHTPHIHSHSHVHTHTLTHQNSQEPPHCGPGPWRAAGHAQQAAEHSSGQRLRRDIPPSLSWGDSLLLLLFTGCLTRCDTPFMGGGCTHVS